MLFERPLQKLALDAKCPRNPIHMKPTRLRAEAALRKELRGAIRAELAMLASAEQLLYELAHTMENGSEVENKSALAKLFARTAADLRAMQLLLERGYGLQALTLGASAYEHLITIAYIGGVPEHGKAWLTREELFKVPSPNYLAPKIRQRVTSYSYVSVESEPGKHRDAIYTMLCAAKHGNPLIEAKGGIVSSADAHYLSASPQFSPEMVSRARLAAYGIARGLVQALHVLVEERVVNEPDSPVAIEAFTRATTVIEKFRER